MTNLRYEEPAPASPTEVRAAIDRGDAETAARTLIGAAFHHESWRDVQELCLEILESEDSPLAALAATCLGHLARIHGQLDTDVVRPALERHRNSETVGPHVEDAVADIDWYVGGSAHRENSPSPEQYW